MAAVERPGVTLVTGAGGGIGAAVARLASLGGATVVALDRDGARLTALAGEVAASDGDLHLYTVDVTDAEAVAALVELVEADLGPVEALVNVAGVLRTGAVEQTSTEDWAAVFAVNATGVFHTCRAVAPRMRARRRGAIVTVASNAAGVPRANMAAYAASKAAAAHFTRCLGLELAPHGVRCNVVNPGSTDTVMGRAAWPGEQGIAEAVAGRPATFNAGIPLGRVATASDVAEAVLFLLSDRARHVALHDLYVDGGAALRA